MIPFLKKAFDFFLFSSVFIAVCAVLMVNQTHQLFHLEYLSDRYLWFVFFSTITSYNFHWYLTPHASGEIERTAWSVRHKKVHFLLIIIGCVGSVYTILYFSHFWVALGIAAVLTFLYSAPKIPHPLFAHLKKVAIGKTIYLSFVWLYVTTILPFVFTQTRFTGYELLFCLSRFFLIYAICIIFDYRDRENDRKEGMRSLITYFNDKQTGLLFYFSSGIYLFSTLLLGLHQLNWTVIGILLLPLPLLVYIYPRSKNNFSDYLYYFVLDGLMAFSSLLTLFVSI